MKRHDPSCKSAGWRLRYRDAGGILGSMGEAAQMPEKVPRLCRMCSQALPPGFVIKCRWCGAMVDVPLLARAGKWVLLLLVAVLAYEALVASDILADVAQALFTTDPYHSSAHP